MRPCPLCVCVCVCVCCVCVSKQRGKSFFSHVKFADFKSFLTKITKNCLSLITEITTEIKNCLKIAHDSVFHTCNSPPPPLPRANCTCEPCVICDLWFVSFSQFLSHGLKINNNNNYWWLPFLTTFSTTKKKSIWFNTNFLKLYIKNFNLTVIF